MAISIGTPTLLLSATSAVSSGSATAVCTGTAAPGALVVVKIAVQQTGSTHSVSSLIDSAGNSYSLAVASGATSSSYDNVELWYCSNIQYRITTSTTFTCTIAGTTPTYRLFAAQVTGANGGLDKTSSSNGYHGTSPSVATGTLSTATQVVFAANLNVGSTATFTESTSSAFTTLETATIQKAALEGDFAYDVVAATTTVTYAPTTATAYQTIVIASFKAGIAAVSLSQTTGSYTETVNSLTPMVARKLSQTTTSYTETGIGLQFGFGQVANTGTYTETVSSLTPICSGAGATLTSGDANLETTSVNNVANNVFGNQIVLYQATSLQSFSVYIANASPTATFGIYDNNGAGGNPGNLLASVSGTLAPGWNTVSLSTSYPLAAGTYWIVCLTTS